MQGLRGRLTFANVVSVTALFVALGGGAYAAVALPKNSVGAAQLRKDAVSSRAVKNGSLSAADFSSSALGKMVGARGATGLQGPAGKDGASGANGSDGAQGAAGPSDILYVSRANLVTLATAGATGTTVATLSGIPAGKWLVQGNVVAVNFGPVDFMRCGISVGGKTYGGSTASVGTTHPAEDLGTTVPVTLTDATDATMSCSHDVNLASAPYVESVGLFAIRTGNLDARIEP